VAILEAEAEEKRRQPPRGLLPLVLTTRDKGSMGADRDSDDHTAGPEDVDDEDRPLTAREVNMLSGILQNMHKPVESVLVSIDQAFCMPSDTRIGPELWKQFTDAGYSRVPVYEGEDKANIRSFIHIKRLMAVDPWAGKETPLKEFFSQRPVIIDIECTLGRLLHLFQGQKAHLAVVSRDDEATKEALDKGLPLTGDARVIGIVTMYVGWMGSAGPG
jgi:CBS domain containing-hemolysin-like protein